MIKKLKKGIREGWHEIKSQVDFEHLGFHIENYTTLFLSTFGMAFFALFAFMEWAYYPVLLVGYRMTVVAPGDIVGVLFKTWPLLSFGISEFFFVAGLCWSTHEFGKAFSSYDYHYKRVIELRVRISDVEGGVEGDGKSNEWLKRLNFQDSNEARKISNFAFMGKQLGFNVKKLVERKFAKDSQ